MTGFVDDALLDRQAHTPVQYIYIYIINKKYFFIQHQAHLPVQARVYKY